MCNFVSTTNIVITYIIPGVVVFHALLLCTFSFQLVSAQEQIRIEAFTDQGTFKVQIIWTPNEVGRPNTFEIHFFDPDTSSEIENIKYDISIYKDDIVKVQRLDQVSIFQEFFFEEVGSYQIRIGHIEDLEEHVMIPIQVTPEFGFDIFIFSAIALSIAILGAQINRNNLFGHAHN